MGLLDFLNLRNKATRFALIGRWKQFQTDFQNENVELEIKKNGRLTYSIHHEGKIEIINLSFKISGDTLITDQSSSPCEERTKFWFESDDILVLALQGS